MGVFYLINFSGLKWLWTEWSWAEIVICQNNPQSGDFGAGPLLYYVCLIVYLVLNDASTLVGHWRQTVLN